MLGKTSGIVIRTTDYGETGKIVSLYTEEAGKITVMARGAKKARSRLSAVTQLFTYGEFVYYKRSGMGTLNDAEVIRSRAGLRSDIEQTAFAAYIVELVDRLVEDGESSPALFRQLNAALDRMEEGKDAQIITYIFELKMFQMAGIAPVLDECASCGDTENRLSLWSPRLGGTVCIRCSPDDPYGFPLYDKPRKLLSLFRHVDLTRLGNIDISDQNRTHLKQMIRSFSDEHLPFSFKSRRFLDQMERFL